MTSTAQGSHEDKMRSYTESTGHQAVVLHKPIFLSFPPQFTYKLMLTQHSRKNCKELKVVLVPQEIENELQNVTEGSKEERTVLEGMQRFSRGIKGTINVQSGR